MTKKDINLPSIPISRMRPSDMDGSPSSALMVLFHLAADIGLELERLEERVAASMEQTAKIPHAVETELRACYTKFIEIHKSAISNLAVITARNAKNAKAFAEAQSAFKSAEERAGERISILVEANCKLVAVCEATLAANSDLAKSVSGLKSLLDRSLWQLFRGWLALRFSR